jgi:hypothetical protein
MRQQQILKRARANIAAWCCFTSVRRDGTHLGPGRVHQNCSSFFTPSPYLRKILG